MKVSKVRTCFGKVDEDYYLVQFELYEESTLLFRGGKNSEKYANWFETSILDGETFVGF